MHLLLSSPAFVTHEVQFESLGPLQVRQELVQTKQAEKVVLA